MVAASPALADPVGVDFVFPDEAASRDLRGTVAEGHLSLELVLLGDDGRPVAREDAEPGLVTVFQVQRALDADFADPVIHHDGPATTVFISGLPDGEHRFRVRGRTVAADDFEAGADADAAVADAAWGPWSEPAAFAVQHQSMTLALSLFSVGAVLFVALVVIVVQGSRDPYRGLDDPADAPEGAARA